MIGYIICFVLGAWTGFGFASFLALTKEGEEDDER